MAERERPDSRPEPTRRPNLIVSRTEAESRITAQVEKGEKGEKLLQTPIVTKVELAQARNEFSTWDEFNTELLRRLFDMDEVAAGYGLAVGYAGHANPTFEQLLEYHQNCVGRKVRKLRSVRDKLSLYEEPARQHTADEKALPSSSKVFVIHGRNERFKHETARLLREIGLEPVILGEQPRESNTIIEAIEKHSDVAYAVVLMTGDDVGGSASQPDSLDPRARQNVIFELACSRPLGRRPPLDLFLLQGRQQSRGRNPARQRPVARTALVAREGRRIGAPDRRTGQALRLLHAPTLTEVPA